MKGSPRGTWREFWGLDTVTCLYIELETRSSLDVIQLFIYKAFCYSTATGGSLMPCAVHTPANAISLIAPPASHNFVAHPRSLASLFQLTTYENVDPSAGWGSFLCCGNAMNLYERHQAL